MPCSPSTFSATPSAAPIRNSCRLEAVINDVRTSLVHNAGIATESFVKQAKRFDDWKNVGNGELLPLDGKNASRMTDSFIAAANHLLQVVDAWFVAHSSQDSRPPAPDA